MFVIQKDATSNTIYVFIRGSATSPVGMGLTGLAYNTAGLSFSYVRAGGSRTAITLATLASPSAAWSSGGFIEVDGTNQPGLYRLDLPDAAVATNLVDTIVTWKGANSIDDGVVISVVDYDPSAADPDIATIKAAVDTEVAAIKAKTDQLVFTTANKVDAKLTADGMDNVFDAADKFETGLTLRGFFRLASAALFGKASGLATTTAVFRNAIADSKARITATVDVDGNRTAVTTDQT